MGIKRQLSLFAIYFFMASTALQSEDAFVFYYQSVHPAVQKQLPSKTSRMIASAILAAVAYITLLVSPYLNVSLHKLAMSSCIGLFMKYICQLMTFTHFLINWFKMAAILLDVSATALFYLTIFASVQVVIDKHQQITKKCKILSWFSALYGLSIMIGYAISYASYTKMPVWLFLIMLTCFMALAGTVLFFAYFQNNINPIPFVLQEEAQQNQAQQRQQQNIANPGDIPNPNDPNGQQVGDRIQLGFISLQKMWKLTLKLYSKMSVLIWVQIMLGYLIGYSFNLLQYLIWTSQTQQISVKLSNNAVVMVLYGLGAIFSSIGTGVMCDLVKIRTVGYGVTSSSMIVLPFLYLGISVDSFYTTTVIFMFVGMSIFGIFTWLICACSKTFGGKLQTYSVNAQFVGVFFGIYQIGNIFCAGKIDMQVRLALQLGIILLMCGLCILSIKHYPFEGKKQQIARPKQEIVVEMQLSHVNNQKQRQNQINKFQSQLQQKQENIGKQMLL